MNENLANEIRKTIESVKDLKTEASGINNHLGSLEGLVRFDNQKKVDEAYQRGYDKGYEDKTNNDEVCNELAKDIYQRGLNDAWEAARKIVLSPDEGGTSLPELFAIFGGINSMQRIFRSYSASEAIEKLKAYEKKQKADDDIKVGDVVERYINGKFNSTGIFLGEDGNYWNCLFWTGAVFTTFAYPKNQFKKTGIHLGIDKIMEEMRNE